MHTGGQYDKTAIILNAPVRHHLLRMNQTDVNRNPQFHQFGCQRLRRRSGIPIDVDLIYHIGPQIFHKSICTGYHRNPLNLLPTHIFINDDNAGNLEVGVFIVCNLWQALFHRHGICHYQHPCLVLIQQLLAADVAFEKHTSKIGKNHKQTDKHKQHLSWIFYRCLGGIHIDQNPAEDNKTMCYGTAQFLIFIAPQHTGIRFRKKHHADINQDTHGCNTHVHGMIEQPRPVKSPTIRNNQRQFHHDHIHDRKVQMLHPVTLFFSVHSFLLCATHLSYAFTLLWINIQLSA